MGRRTKNHPFSDQWLEDILKTIQNSVGSQGIKPALSYILQTLINAIMEKERDIFLKEHPENSANGFYRRKLYLSFDNLDLKVPRVRFGNSFRPAILPERWKRVDKDYEELLIAMLANGYSKAQIQRTLKKLKLPYSQESLDDVIELIKDRLDFFKRQPLKSDWFAVFVDAYWGKLKDPETKNLTDVSIFVALGIDLDGFKHILGYWVLKGRESKSFWLEVFQDLINRGLKRTLILVTDDFRGITDVVSKLFPYAQHQLCLIHLMRNFKARLSKKDYKKVRNILTRIKTATNKEEGESLFMQLCEVVKEKYPNWSKELEKKAQHYLAFLDYPTEVRKHIYSTNPVESINSGLQRMAVEMGNFFPSERALEVNLFIQLANLQDKWLQKPLPAVRGVSYELYQKFVLTYGVDVELCGR